MLPRIESDSKTVFQSANPGRNKMNWSQPIGKFLAGEEGPTIVEYAVLIALIVGMMFASIIYVGNEAQRISEIVVDGMDTTLNN